MAQIVNRDTIAERLGTGLGGGFARGLDSLAQEKLRAMHEQRALQKKHVEDKNFYDAAIKAGFPPEDAELFVQFSEPSRAKLLQQRFEKKDVLQQNRAAGNALNELFGASQEPAAEQQSAQPSGPTIAQPSKQGIPSEKTQVGSAENASDRLKRALKTPGLTSEGRKQLLAQYNAEKKLEATEKIQEKRIDAKVEAEEKKQALESYKQISKEAKGAQEEDKKLKRIEELSKTGDLGSPAFNALAHGLKNLKLPWFGSIPVDVTFLQTADAQELDKLSTDFFRGAKDIFGARVTEGEIKLMLKALPNLLQSNAGRLRVVRSLRASNAARSLKKKTADKIIKENNNRIPNNLDELIEERVGDQLGNLWQKFESITEMPQEAPKSLLARALGVNRGQVFPISSY
jgi:hypothetical protein